jgi:succinyl-CoA synthetase alpha subunit
MNGFPLALKRHTPVLVQGVAGRQGSFHAARMREYGTNVLAGVDPGHGGAEVEGTPVYDSVSEAVDAQGRIDWSVVFVPAPYAKGACLEALRAGLNLAVITEGIPVHDTLAILEEAQRQKRRVIGPNCPGLAVPGEAKLGILPGGVLKPGSAGVVSRSGTLTYEIVEQLSRAGLGQRLVVGIGGDPVPGTSFEPVLEWFERDPAVQEIVLIGEIGGDLEERAADYVRARVSKPVVAYVAGRHAPPERRMGHAGAIVMGERGTAASKIEALKEAEVLVAKYPWEVPRLLRPERSL